MTAERPRRLLLSAIEPSADEIGAALINALRARAPDTVFTGCGGPAMARTGFESLFDTRELAVMGFSDVARVMHRGFKQANALALAAQGDAVDAAIFIDGWAFSRIAARRFARRVPSVQRYKLAAPQVWASRPQRVQFVRDYFDGVLCLLPFETHWFERAGIPTHYVGNPNFQRAYHQRGDGEAFRQRHGLSPETPLLAVLPGSRQTEYARLREPFRETVSRLHEKYPALRLVIPVSPSLDDDDHDTADLGRHAPAGRGIRSALAQWPGHPILVSPAEKYDAFAAADVALAASGTVTTELAIHHTPVVVAYRVDPLTAIWARRVMTAAYASIINIAADREILPEFIQEACTADRLTPALDDLLASPAAREAQINAFAPVLRALDLGGAPAADRAADCLLGWIDDHRKSSRH